MAMPWKRGKQIAAALRGDYDASGKVPFPEGYTGSRTLAQLTALFDACFRIQREACQAAGRYIPMVVENVKGAQPWVGRAKANFGSFYLWGDVAMVGIRVVCGVQFGSGAMPMRAQKFNPDGTDHPPGSWFAVADSKNRDARKVDGFNFHEHEKTGKPGRSFQSAAVDGQKVPVYSDPRRNGGKGAHLTSPRENEGGTKNGKDWFGSGEDCSLQRRASSGSSSRKAASAQIAKIPLELSRYIARSYHPQGLQTHQVNKPASNHHPQHSSLAVQL